MWPFEKKKKPLSFEEFSGGGTSEKPTKPVSFEEFSTREKVKPEPIKQNLHEYADSRSGVGTLPQSASDFGRTPVEKEPPVAKPVDLITREEREAKTAGDFSAGFSTGVKSLKQLGAGAVALVGDATGNERVRQWGVEKYKKAEAEMAPFQAGRTTQLEDIHSVGSAVDWAQFNLGQVTPSMIESVGSAIIGAGIGTTVATPGVGTAVGGVTGFVAKETTKKFLAKQVSKFVAKGVAKDVAEEQAKKELVKKVGSGMVMFGNSYVQGMGDVYGETMDEEGQGNVMASFLGSVPYAMVDTFADMTLLNRALSGSEGTTLLRRLAKSVSSGAVMEGTQEAIQEIDLMIAGLNSGKEYTAEEVISRLGNSFASAGLAGGVGGIAGARKSSVVGGSDPNDALLPPQQNIVPGEAPTPPDGGTPPTAPKTEPQDYPKKAVEFLSVLDDGDQEAIDEAKAGVSKKELEVSLEILDRAAEQATPDQKAKITLDRLVVEGLVKEREDALMETAGELVSTGKNEANKVEAFPLGDQQQVKDYVKQYAEQTGEEVPDVEVTKESPLYTETKEFLKDNPFVGQEPEGIAENSEAAKQALRDMRAQESKPLQNKKKDLLAKKKATETATEKKAIQKQVDALDEEIRNIETATDEGLTLVENQANAAHAKAAQDVIDEIYKVNPDFNLASFLEGNPDLDVIKTRLEEEKKNKASGLTKSKKSSNVKAPKEYDKPNDNSRGGDNGGELSGDVQVGESEQSRTGTDDQGNDGSGRLNGGNKSTDAGIRYADGRELAVGDTVHDEQGDTLFQITKISTVDGSVHMEPLSFSGVPIGRIVSRASFRKNFTKVVEVGGKIAETQDLSIGRVLLDIVKNNGGDIQDENLYVKVKREGYEDLYVERLDNTHVAMAHTRIQNGDVMFDPEVVFEIREGQLIPKTIETSPYPQHEIKPNDEFLKTWSENLIDQGFTGQEVKSIKKSELGIPMVNAIHPSDRKYTKKEIEELAMSKDSFTEAEKDILRQYEGSGGQKDGEGRGVLDEYYTPQAIVDKMWTLVDEHVPKGRRNVVEPSAGIGRFLAGAKGSTIVALETNPVSAKIARVLYPDARIINNPFESLFIDEKGKKKYVKAEATVVIGNPPYGIHRGKYKGLGEEPKIGRYEDYFIKRSMDITVEGGVVAMIVPSGFLRGKEYYAKKEIVKLGYLADAYRLPNKSFGTTDIGTDILIFKKDRTEDNSRMEDIVQDGFFVKNPEKVLGTETQKQGKFGMEPFVEGSLEDALSRINNEKQEGAIVEAEVEESVEVADEFPETVKKAVKKEGVKRSRVVRTKKTKAQRAKKDTEIKGVLKRNAERPYLVVGTKKSGLKEFTQGTVDKSEQKYLDYTSEDGSLTADFVASMSAEEKESLNFAGGEYFTDYNYYQGDTIEKLTQLENDKATIPTAQYKRQKAGLEAIKPETVGVDKITLTPIDKLAKEIKLANGKSLLDNFTEWLKELPYDAFEGASRWEIGGYINSQPVRGGNEEQNAKERVRRRRVGNKLFRKFYNEELEAADKEVIAERFNRTFNSYVKPDYTQYPVSIKMFDKFYGDDFNIKPIQMEGAGFLMNKGVGVLAYEVGVGKTLAAIAAISGVMQKGWAKRPLIVVPKNLKTKWIRDLTESMPNVKINDLANLGGAFAFNGDRKGFEIEDGTISIITEDGFKRIGFTDETYNRLTEKLEDVLYERGVKKSKRDSELDTVKTEETMGKAMKGTDFPVTFENLGFDHITLDEAHRAKNVFAKAKAKGEKGQSANEYGAIRGAVSERGLKTYLATQYVLEQNKGRNVFLLTATPFNNSPIEIYSILSLVAKARLEQLGITNINDFISLFVDLESKYAIKANGSVQLTDQVRKFGNLQQLQKLVREYIDFRTGEEAKVKRPTKEKLTPYLKMTKLQAEMIEKAQELFTSKFRQEGGTLLAITELQKITFSPYLSRYTPKPWSAVTPQELIENSPKLQYVVEAIKKVHQVNPNAGQIIYSEKGIELFRPIRDYFVKTLKYKPEEVAIIDSSLTDDAKDDVQLRFQNGEVKILLASGTVKEGVDLQKNSTDLYNLYLQWNPTDMIQVEGRTWRQGSFYDKVRIHYPLIQNSIDPFIFQKLEEKASRISNIFSYKGDSLDVSDIDFEGMKFELITDPVMRVNAKYEYDRAEMDDKFKIAEAELAFMERRVTKIDELEGAIKNYKEYKEQAKAQPDGVSDVAYYSEKIADKQKELTEEKDKLTKKNINIEEVKKEIVTKKESIAAIRKQADALVEKNQEEVKKAQEEKFNVIHGKNNFDELLTNLNEEAFFTHDGNVHIGKLPKDVRFSADDLRATTVPAEEAIKTLERYQKRLGISFNTHLADIILMAKAETAIGAAYEGEVSLQRMVARFAADHELMHIIFNSLSEIPAFQKFNARTIRREVMADLKRQGGEYENLRDVDEAMAIGFEHYVDTLESSPFSKTVKEFFMTLLAEIKRFLGVGGDGLLDLYREIYFGRSYFTQTALETKGITQLLTREVDIREAAILAGMPRGELEKKYNLYGRDKVKIIDFTKESFARATRFLAEVNETPIEKDGRNLMEFENGDLTLPELKKKLEIAEEGKEEAWLIEKIKEDIAKAETRFKKDGIPKVQREETLYGLHELIHDHIPLTDYIEVMELIDLFEDKKYTIQLEDINEAKKYLDKYGYSLKDAILERLGVRFKKDVALIKGGHVSVAALYRKVYSEFYEGKPTPMNALEDEKIIRGVTKRAFTLGKRYGKKITKENYVAINKEIKQYILTRIPVKHRGGLLRAVISAKNEMDVKKIVERVDALQEKIETRGKLLEEIHKAIEMKKIRNYNNLRKAWKFPTIHHMTVEQLTKFNEAMQTAQVGETFLSQRQIETVDNTELKGIKTLREARERLAQRMGVKVIEVTNISAGEMDKLRYDSSLAEKNPLYEVLVDDTNRAMLEAEMHYYAIQEKTNEMIKAARKSRPRGIIERLIPTDERIFKYLEATNKTPIAAEMTNEEIAVAEYIQLTYAEVRDYLLERKMMDQHRENYITHIRRTFLESWKEDGLIEAFKNVFQEYQEQEQNFNILDGDTGEILPMEKFFQFAMHRSGVIKPTKNVADAFLTYMRTFEKKKAFDAIIPKLEIYTDAVANEKKTKGDLFIDRSLKKLVRTWINNKKGRRDNIGGIVKQGGKIDLIIRFANSFVSLIDLGFSLPVGVASQGGEQVTNLIMLGAKNWTKGHARALTEKGVAIGKKYESFTQQDPWSTFIQASDNAADYTLKSAFMLFRDAQWRANRQFLLGSLTDAEYESETVSQERLALLKREMGRWRVVEGAESIIGSTSAGKAASKYKAWAVPILRTTLDNLNKIRKDKSLLKSREGQELLRSAMISGFVALAVYALMGGDDDKKQSEMGFFEKLMIKVIRDLLSSTSVLNPNFWATTPRIYSWLQSFTAALAQLVTLEEYKTTKKGEYKKGELKGDDALLRTVTPSVWKQFEN